MLLEEEFPLMLRKQPFWPFHAAPALFLVQPVRKERHIHLELRFWNHWAAGTPYILII